MLQTIVQNTYTYMPLVYIAVYHIREGFYDVFYPPMQVLDLHLALRAPTALGNTVAPFNTQSAAGGYWHNGIKNNIW
jgi:hypothetical protein